MPEDLDDYLQLITEDMNFFRTVPASSLKSGSKESLDYVSRVAAFYHRTLNAMPFFGVNNSIAMSQVNYLLLRQGFEPLQHGYLDLNALFLSTKDFSKLFEKVVSGKISPLEI